jgi:hypothetical protein
MAESVDSQVAALVLKARKARAHAARLGDPRTVKSLMEYADELDQRIAALREGTQSDALQHAADAPQGEPQTGPELIAAMKPAAPEDPEPDAPPEAPLKP